MMRKRLVGLDIGHYATRKAEASHGIQIVLDPYQNRETRTLLHFKQDHLLLGEGCLPDQGTSTPFASETKSSLGNFSRVQTLSFFLRSLQPEKDYFASVTIAHSQHLDLQQKLDLARAAKFVFGPDTCLIEQSLAASLDFYYTKHGVIQEYETNNGRPYTLGIISVSQSGVTLTINKLNKTKVQVKSRNTYKLNFRDKCKVELASHLKLVQSERSMRVVDSLLKALSLNSQAFQDIYSLNRQQLHSTSYFKQLSQIFEDIRNKCIGVDAVETIGSLSRAIKVKELVEGLPLTQVLNKSQTAVRGAAVFSASHCALTRLAQVKIVSLCPEQITMTIYHQQVTTKSIVFQKNTKVPAKRIMQFQPRSGAINLKVCGNQYNLKTKDQQALVVQLTVQLNGLISVNTWQKARLKLDHVKLLKQQQRLEQLFNKKAIQVGQQIKIDSLLDLNKQYAKKCDVLNKIQNKWIQKGKQDSTIDQIKLMPLQKLLQILASLSK